jgi:glycosyltransferase involved in cell wall biosynthesis
MMEALPRASETSNALAGETRSHRVLHVIFSMSPRDGGPPEGVRQLALNYKAIGDQVEVVTLDDPQSPFLAAFEFPVHALGPPPISYGISRRLIRWLAANVRRFDLVVINGVWLFPAVAAWRAAIDAGVPYVVFTHGALDIFFKKRYPIKHLKKMVYWPLQYRILRQAAAVLFTSESERDFALASFWPNRWKSLVIPYGTNKPSGDPVQQCAAFYAKAPQLVGKRFLLFLSRIHEKKGCDLLIEAFATAARQNDEIHLVMAGPDQVGWQAKLEEQAQALGIAERVHWPGMLGGDVKYGAFYAAEAFVLPSHQENFGIAVAEALACGRPVLISDQINIWRDIVQDSVGYVAPDTLEGTRQLLERWLCTPESERQAMAHRALDTFHTRYSLRRSAEAIHAFTAALLPREAKTSEPDSSGSAYPA